MAIGVSLWFDADLETRVRDLWRALSEAGIDSPLFDGRYRPHITLGVWEAVQHQDLQEAIHPRVRDWRKFGVEFRSIGLLPEGDGVVFLQPLVTDALLAIQREAFMIASTLGVPTLPYYAPGCWIPHCTMAWHVSRDRILKAADLLLADALPLKGTATAVGIVDTPAEIELRRFELQR